MMLLPAPTTVVWTFFFVSSDFEFHSELTLPPFNYLNYAEFWPFEEDLIFFENHVKSYLVNEMTSSSLEKHSSVMISLLQFFCGRDENIGAEATYYLLIARGV